MTTSANPKRLISTCHSAQIYRTDMSLAFYVRAQGDPGHVLNELRAQTRAIDPNVTVFDAVPLKEYIGASLYHRRLRKPDVGAGQHRRAARRYRTV